MGYAILIYTSKLHDSPQQNYPSTNIKISDPTSSKDFPKIFNPQPQAGWG